MTYTEMTALFRNKVCDYTAYQCGVAMDDIYTTLRFIARDMADPYVTKLYCELDAVRDRLAHLQRKHN